MSFHVITKPGCPYCDKAKGLLSARGKRFSEDRRVSEDEIADFKARGFRTFPQVFENDKLVGGFDQLQIHLAAGEDDDF